MIISDNGVVSVIIPYHDNVNTILELIVSVFETQYDKYEVIVVSDDANEDLFHSIVGDLYFGKIKFFHLLPCSPGEARNYGAKMASGEYIFFLDADVVIFPDTVGLMVQKIKRTSALCLGGRVIPYELKNCYERFDALFFEINFGYTEGYVEFLPTINLFLRKDTFDSMHGFCPDFFVGEDLGLCRKLIIFHSNAILYCPSIVVKHRHAKTLKKIIKNSLCYAIENNEILLAQKISHFVRLRWIIYDFFWCLRSTFYLLTIPRGCRMVFLIREWLYFFGSIAGFVKYFLLRYKSQALLKYFSNS